MFNKQNYIPLGVQAAFLIMFLAIGWPLLKALGITLIAGSCAKLIMFPKMSHGDLATTMAICVVGHVLAGVALGWVFHKPMLEGLGICYVLAHLPLLTYVEPKSNWWTKLFKS